MPTLKRWMRVWSVAIWAGLCVVMPAAAQTANPPPVEDFFKPSQVQDAQLSPSGRWLALLAPIPNRRVGLMFIDLEGKVGTHFAEASTTDDVIWFRWVNDDWIVFALNDPDYRGSGYREGGLATMRRDGSSVRLLIAREFEPFDGVRRRYLDHRHFYLAPGRPGTTEIIVGETMLDARYEFSHITPKVLNVETGSVRSLLDGAPRADRWWFDAQGRARVAAFTNEGRTTLHWADAKTGAWREISSAPRFDQPFVPSYIDGEDTLVVNAANADSSLDLRRFDFANGAPEAEALLRTPGFDSGVVAYRERPSGKVVGLQVDVDAITTVWFKPEMVKLQAAVDAKLPGYVNVLQCSPCDNPNLVVVYSFSDVDPGHYLLYRPKEDKWDLLGSARPNIKAKQMAAMEFHRTKARDGTDLPLWITKPSRASNEAARPAPAVVLVHGGPHTRGASWGWDAEAQFLASRGYVVVQPEFRGSTGYGAAHFRAGWKQWGRAMQDDISDALKFAVDKGWVDASRVCIMGSSYGGYAALMGLVKDPEQYRCGIAHAAVSDPRFMYEFHWSDISEEGRKYSLPLTLGDPKADAAMLAAASPLEHVERIKSPVLLVHGKVDRRVPIQNSERMLNALRKHGKSVEWVTYTDEGHGFSRTENEVDYYRKVEAFLATHLK